MAQIAEFMQAYERSIRTKNFIRIIAKYTEMLKGYYFALEGIIPPEAELQQEAVEIFSEKKKNGYFNDLNEPVTQEALKLNKKNNIVYFPKKEDKCQKKLTTANSAEL